MKKIRIIPIAAMALMCAVSCSKSKVAEPRTAAGVPSEFSGITTDESESKAYVERDGGKYLVKWANGDQVIITDGNKTGTFTANSYGTTTTDFTHASGDVPDTAPFTAYSPASYYSGGQLVIPAEQTYTNANVPVFPIVGKNEGHSIVFESIMSVIKLRIKPLTTVKVNTIKLKSGNGELLNGKAAITFAAQAQDGKYAVSNVEFSGGTDILTVNYTGGITLNGNSENDLLIAIPAGAYAAEFKITLITDDGKEETRTQKESFTLERSKIHGTTELIPYDLVFGYCYGEANTIVAYSQTSVDIDITPYAIALGDAVLKDFTRVANPMFAPKPASAELVWREEGLANTISVIPDFANNKVTVSGLGGSGNALVAIKDAGGKILWSYQIWKPEDDVLNESNLKTYNGYQVLPVTIGATKIATKDSENAIKVAACGSLYQWGRKDPLGRSSSITSGTNTMVKIYDAGGSEINLEDANHIDKTIRKSEEWTLSQAINNTTQNPTVTIGGMEGSHVSGSGGVNYATTWYPNDVNHKALWGNPNNTASASYKSVYDPCPAGYKVPGTAQVFQGANSSNFKLVTSSGYEVSLGSTTDFLPACGSRSFWSRQGTFGDAGTHAYCQSSAASDSAWDLSCNLYLMPTSVNAANSGTWPSFAISVRCVME